ncbi:MAG TPA: hypothetical protein QF764_11545 [Planctomycetota bacterium]|nr:hypothetical protein [Planctomycetota bacterium]HJP02392.1 hypothetical protein [Planctomycetota bacterium]
MGSGEVGNLRVHGPQAGLARQQAHQTGADDGGVWFRDPGHLGGFRRGQGRADLRHPAQAGGAPGSVYAQSLALWEPRSILGEDSGPQGEFRQLTPCADPLREDRQVTRNLGAGALEVEGAGQLEARARVSGRELCGGRQGR